MDPANQAQPLTVTFDFGLDKFERSHLITAEWARGPDGTLGIRLISSCSGLTFKPCSNSECFVTTLRPDTMPPKEA